MPPQRLQQQGSASPGCHRRRNPSAARCGLWPALKFDAYRSILAFWRPRHVPADNLPGTLIALADGKRAGVQGYMPTDLYNLNSGYGSADSLKRCAAASMWKQLCSKHSCVLLEP